MSPPQNPCAAGDWRFTWEAQSHIPTLRLYLFNSTNSTLNITSVNATLIVDQYILAVIFDDLTINVPVPRVLVDFEADIMCKAYDNYIEAKLVLLLPVDHPLLSDFEDKCNLEGNYCLFDEIQPLCMDYDLKRVSTLEEVSIYCRNCSVKLTSALRFFEEMPSVNWQDVADNWFGGCCCSFGGIGEKLVMRYARSYKHTPGVCLLSHTSVVLCTDDLLECGFSDTNGENDEFKSAGDEASALLALPVLLEKRTESFKDTNGEVGCPCPEEHHLAVNIDSASAKETDSNNLYCTVSDSETDDQIPSSGTCSACCPHEGVVSNLNEQIDEANGGLLENQKSFLNGYLGNGFMEKSSGISKDIKWSEYLCPQCSHLLGGYPCSGKSSPLDGRVRLYKSYISTSLPVGGSNDVFRNYSLERMFTSQLLESAKDELSFRTVVSDLQTHDPVVQIILLNPNLWCYTGCCSDTKKLDMRIYMRPTVKVLFSACNNNGDSVSRDLKGWGSKDQADEVYMLPTQLEELIGTLELSKDIFPSSDIFLQGFSVSTLMRGNIMDDKLMSMEIQFIKLLMNMEILLPERLEQVGTVGNMGQLVVDIEALSMEPLMLVVVIMGALDLVDTIKESIMVPQAWEQVLLLLTLALVRGSIMAVVIMEPLVQELGLGLTLGLVGGTMLSIKANMEQDMEREVSMKRGE